jgi:CRISPR-associated protein Csd2
VFPARAGMNLSDDDLKHFWEALTNMWDHDRSASKGVSSCRGLYVLEHVGTDSDPNQRVREAMPGCAAALWLRDYSTPQRTVPNAIVEIGHREGLTGSPRTFGDHVVTVREDRLPAGVELFER